MPMNTFTVEQLRGDILLHSMNLLQDDPKKLPEGYYSARVEPGLGMLVEPVNGHAFVFLLPNTICQFESEPGSGTDKLRQRIHAGLFFDQTVANHHAEAARKLAGAARVAAVLAEKSAEPYEPMIGDRIAVAYGAEAKINSVVTKVESDGSFTCISSSSGMRGDFGPDDFLKNGYTVALIERPAPSPAPASVRRNKP
jgi:hypothetical protein